MDVGKTQLYDAFGELIYAIAQVDGVIQEAEIQKLRELLLGHAWAAEIEWSFNYEKKKTRTVEEAMAKALETCKSYGPSSEYAFLLEVLYLVAKASDGVQTEEQAIIDQFKRELTEHFAAAS